MAKHDRTGRTKAEPKHARLYGWMEQTPAWRHLSGNAVRVWLVASLIYDGRNNGKLALSGRDIGERTNLHYTSVARALLELENAGFLVRVKASSFSQKKLAAEYRLTHFKCDVTQQLPTKDFATRGEAT